MKTPRDNIERQNAQSGIETSTSYFNYHKKLAYYFSLALAVEVALLTTIDAALVATTPRSPIDNNAFYVFNVVMLAVLGTTAAFYKYQLNEISRSEQYVLGFKRARMAAEFMTQPAHHLELIRGLVVDAFKFELASKSKGRFESPLPGHPTSELVTFLLNQIDEQRSQRRKRD